MKAFLLIYLLLGASISLAQAPQESPSPSPSPELDDGWTEPIVYSSAEKKAACKRFNGKYVGYYEHVYIVEKCKLREIQSYEVILQLNKKQQKIEMIESDIIAKLEKGDPIVESTHKKVANRSCKQLENRYVTFTYTDIYLLQKCKKRIFPDWTSFMAHRKKNARAKEEVLALTWAEFTTFAEGVPMSSVVDEEYQKQSVMAHNVDVISIDEACKGLNGKEVSYVDKLYRIEKCRKREYNAEEYLKKHRGSEAKFRELTSEQWISLPDGKPMK